MAIRAAICVAFDEQRKILTAAAYRPSGPGHDSTLQEHEFHVLGLGAPNFVAGSEVDRSRRVSE